MLRAALLLGLLALAAAPATAQTCGGSLDFSFILNPDEGAAHLPLPVRYDAVITTVEEAGRRFRRDAPPLPFDSLVAHPERFDVEVEHVGVVGDGPSPANLAVRTSCGYYFIRFVFTPETGGEPAAVDFYNVPPHVPLRLDAPLVVRPGHVRIDLGRVDPLADSPWPYRVYPAAAFEAVEE